MKSGNGLIPVLLGVCPQLYEFDPLHRCLFRFNSGYGVILS
ncbi:conserved hypothetical protein [delta proteobacterium NaphS2]|nr:conserved hypothetical protein [delta proteobacterium NaphS2]